MSKRIQRNLQILSQISDANPFKKSLAPRVFDLGRDFEMDVEAVGLDRRLSQEGKKGKAQGHLRKALRDLRDIQKPLNEYRAKTEEMRAEAKMPAFDKADLVAAMNRRELREASRAMTFGQRAMHMAGKTRDVNFIDAILEQPAWVSGIDVHNPNELEIYEAAKMERLRDLRAPLLDTIAARETVESEALMAVNVVHGDIAADSGLQSREFEDVCKQVESGIGALWLKRDRDSNGNEVIYVLVPEGGGFRGQIADAETVRNGHFFKDFAEYQAARAA